MKSEKAYRQITQLIDDDNIDALNVALAEYSLHTLTRDTPYSNQTLLMYACENGSPAAVSALFEKGVGFYSFKYSDATEFKSAAGNTEHAREVLGLLVDRLSSDGRDVVEYIESDGDPWGKMDGGGDGLTPLAILKSRGDNVALNYLEEVLRKAKQPPQPTASGGRVSESLAKIVGWPAVHGPGNSGCGGPLAALPPRKPSWSYFHKAHELCMFGKAVSDGQACFFLTARHTVVCLDLATGALRWEHAPDYTAAMHKPESIAHVGEVVVADTRVLDKRTGELIIDLQTMAPGVELKKNPVFVAGSSVVRAVEVMERPGECFRVDGLGNAEILKFNMFWIGGGNDDVWFGSARPEPPYQLAALDMKSKEVLWVAEMELGMMQVLDSKICIAGENHVSVVNAMDGSFVSRSYAELSENGGRRSVAMGSQGIYRVEQHGVRAFDFDLNPVWMAESENAGHHLRSVVTAGDWVFAVPKTLGPVTAYTQAEGQEVWSSERNYSAWTMQVTSSALIVGETAGAIHAHLIDA